MKLNSLVDPKKRELVREAIRTGNASLLMKKKLAPEAPMGQTQDQEEREQLMEYLSKLKDRLNAGFRKMIEKVKEEKYCKHNRALLEIIEQIASEFKDIRISIEDPSQEVALLKERLCRFEAKVNDYFSEIDQYWLS